MLLLDEGLAELDTQRRLDLLEAMQKSEQALLTTTDLKLFAPAYVKKSDVWEVSAGAVKVLEAVK